MKCTKRFDGRRMNIALNVELFEEVKYFQYFGSKITVDVGLETEVKCGMKVFSCKAMVMNVQRRLYEGVAVTTALHGPKTWSMAVAEKKKY